MKILKDMYLKVAEVNDEIGLKAFRFISRKTNIKTLQAISDAWPALVNIRRRWVYEPEITMQLMIENPQFDKEYTDAFMTGVVPAIAQDCENFGSYFSEASRTFKMLANSFNEQSTYYKEQLR